MAIPIPTFRGRIEDGKICLELRADFAALIARLDGCDVDLKLSKHRRARSNDQNAYYWGVVIPLLGEGLGYDDEEMHEALKWRFLQRHDRSLPTVRSTTDLSTAEFTEFVDSARRLAAEYGVSIPSSNEAPLA